MEFEFDPDKSTVKPGETRDRLRRSAGAVAGPHVRRDPRADNGRAAVAGDRPDQRQTWSAVVTYRQQRIRIISVRRSRDEEVAIYES